MIEIQNNKILLAGKELQFDNKIIEAAEYEGKVVIVFETDEDGGYDNVFCYTQDLQLLWRIKPAPVAIGGTARSPYVGVDIVEGNCRAIDFYAIGVKNMKIWQLNFELDEYDNLIPIRDFEVEEIQSFDGRSHLSQWKPIQVKRMEPEKGLELSDAPGFIFPVFSRRALECLDSLISKNVEILPLDFNEKEYLGINIITVLDAIDYEKSIYKTYRDGKRIMAFKKNVFLPNVVENVSIFKIPDEKTRYAFVSDEFKQTVEKNNLLGFKFKLVWESEQRPLRSSI